MNLAASLTCLEGPDSGRTVQLPEGPFTVGRAEDNDFVLDDDGVSRHHIRLDVNDSGATITDLGSSHGTYVNGERVESCKLSDGDEIEIGVTILAYDEMLAPAFVPPVAPGAPEQPPPPAPPPRVRVRQPRFDEATDPTMRVRRDRSAPTLAVAPVRLRPEVAHEERTAQTTSYVVIGVLIALCIACAIFFSTPPADAHAAVNARANAAAYNAAMQSARAAYRVKDWKRAGEYAQKALDANADDPAAAAIAKEAATHRRAP